MNIDKAIQHFEYKFRKSWKPTTTDINSLNAIIDYKQMQEDITLTNNENLAKMWVNTLMTLSITKTYNAEQCIQEIDKILEVSVYDWCLLLQEQLPMMRFNAIGNIEFPLKPIEQFSLGCVIENNKKIVAKYETELTNALKFKPKEDDVIRFVKNHVNRVITKFKK